MSLEMTCNKVVHQLVQHSMRKKLGGHFLKIFGRKMQNQNRTLYILDFTILNVVLCEPLVHY